jgi:hypothetical protein
MSAQIVETSSPLARETALLDRFWRGHQLVWLWAAGVVVLIAIIGIPTSRPAIFAIVGFGLLAACSGTPAGWKRVCLEWAPLFALLTLYDILRGLAAHWLTPHSLQQIAIDQWMFGGTILTVRLQHTFYTPGVAHVWDYAAFAVYLTHFFLAIVIAGWLWKTAHDRFRRFATLFVTLTFASFVTYALYPAMPPWLASREAVLQPTAKIIDEMWAHIGLANGSHVLSATGGFANPIAAVPSLHAAYPMLLLLFFWKSLPRYRWLLVSYTLAMAITLIYTGEHYVIDIILGWVYAVVVFVAVSRILDRQQKRAIPVTIDA